MLAASNPLKSIAAKFEATTDQNMITTKKLKKDRHNSKMTSVLKQDKVQPDVAEVKN